MSLGNSYCIYLATYKRSLISKLQLKHGYQETRYHLFVIKKIPFIVIKNVFDPIILVQIELKRYANLLSGCLKMLIKSYSYGKFPRLSEPETGLIFPSI